MRAEQNTHVDLWKDEFEEMAAEIHGYILDSVEDSVGYSEISGGRREVETGYVYTTEESMFKFSLAGTVNSDPDILREGKRKIVLQTEKKEDDSFQRIVERLGSETGSLTERRYGELEIYEFEVDSPYR